MKKKKSKRKDKRYNIAQNYMTRRKGWIWDTWKREQSVVLQTIFLVIKSARRATMQRSLLSFQLISYSGALILK
jgi:hypothetical protein